MEVQVVGSAVLDSYLSPGASSLYHTTSSWLGCIFSPVSAVYQVVYHTLVVRNVGRIYLLAPYIGWNGVDTLTICQQLTPGLSREFWDEHVEECNVEVFHRFFNVLSLFESVSVLCFVFFTVLYTLKRVYGLTPQNH